MSLICKQLSADSTYKAFVYQNWNFMLLKSSWKTLRLQKEQFQISNIGWSEIRRQIDVLLNNSWTLSAIWITPLQGSTIYRTETIVQNRNLPRILLFVLESNYTEAAGLSDVSMLGTANPISKTPSFPDRNYNCIPVEWNCSGIKAFLRFIGQTAFYNPTTNKRPPLSSLTQI